MLEIPQRRTTHYIVDIDLEEVLYNVNQDKLMTHWYTKIIKRPRDTESLIAKISKNRIYGGRQI